MVNKTVLILSLFLLGVALGLVTPQRGSRVDPEKVKAAIATCKTFGSRASYVTCLRKEFQDLVRSDNVSSVMEAIEATTSIAAVSAETSTTSCHEIGHIVGELAQRSGRAPGDLLAACRRSCGYGCAHGVMAGILREDPSRIDGLGTLCSSVSRSDSIACNHGLGHGVADYTAYDVIRALAYCDQLPEVGAKKECATGVFMEIYEAPTQTHTPQPLPDSLDYCDGFPVFARDVCQGTLAVEVYSKDQNIQSALMLCRRLPIGSKDQCAKAVGAKVYFIENGDARGVVRACGKDIEFVSVCLTGALTSSLVIDSTGISGQEICRAGGGVVLSECIASLQELYDEMIQ